MTTKTLCFQTLRITPYIMLFMFFLSGWIILAQNAECDLYITPQSTSNKIYLGFSLKGTPSGDPKIIQTIINGTITPGVSTPLSGDPSPVILYNPATNSECAMPPGSTTQAVSCASSFADENVTFSDNYNAPSYTSYTFELTLVQDEPVGQSAADPVNYVENWELRIENLPSGTQHHIYIQMTSTLSDGSTESTTAELTNIEHCLEVTLSDGTTIDDPALILPETIIGKTSYTPALSPKLTIQNIGSQSLNFSLNITSAGSPFSIDPLPSPATPYTGSGSYQYTLPNGSSAIEVPIKFSPTNKGPKTSILKITYEDPGAPADMDQYFNLTAKAVEVEFVILQDLSGSMNWSLDGKNYSPPVGDSRLALAKGALESVFGLLATTFAGSGNYAFVGFPDPGGLHGTNCHTSLSIFPAANMQAITANITNTAGTGEIDPYLEPAPPTGSGLSARGATPLAEGLETSTALLNPGIMADEKRVLYVLTDGAHNCNSGGSRPTPQDFYDSAGGNYLTMNQIAVFTFGLGKDLNSIEYEEDKLRSLGDNSFKADPSSTEDRFRSADMLSAMDLSTQLKNAFIEAFQLTSLSDPVDSVRANKTNQHKVQVDGTNTSLIFLLQWENSQQDLLDFQLNTPDCQLITSQVADRHPDIGYISGNSYKLFSFKEPFLADSNKVGEWILKVSPDSLVEDRTIVYAYSVIAESQLLMESRFSQQSYFTGDTMQFEIGIGEKGIPLKNALLTTEITYPTVSIKNWLCENIIPQNVLDSIPRKIDFEKTTRAYQKYTALNSVYGMEFPFEKETKTLILYDDGTHGDRMPNDGIYTNQFAETQLPGNYIFNINALGRTLDGSIFTRQAIVDQYVDVNFSPDTAHSPRVFTPIDTVEGLVRSKITHIPKDKFGNFLGLDREDEIVFTVKDATSLSDTTLNDPNGGYATIFQFDPGKQNPVVGINFQGKTVEIPVFPPGARPKRCYIVPFGGPFRFDNNLPLKDEGVYGGRLGCHLSSTIALEGEIGYTQTEDSTKTGGSLWQANISMLYHFIGKSSSPGRVFARGGAGLLHFSDFSGSGSAFAFNLGVGAYYRFASLPFKFRLDVGDYIAFSNPFNSKTTHNIQATLGIVFSFKL